MSCSKSMREGESVQTAQESRMRDFVLLFLKNMEVKNECVVDKDIKYKLLCYSFLLRTFVIRGS